MKLLILVHDGEEVLFFHRINFIDDEEGNATASPKRFDHHPVFFYERGGRLDEKKKDVCIPTRSNGGSDHPLVQFRSSLVNSRGIQEDELPSLYVFDAEDSVSRGLRFLSDDGDLITEETVEEGRFSYVRPSQDRDETRFERCHRAKISNDKAQMPK